MCPDCHSLESEPIEASGEGVLWSYTVTYHAFGPLWENVVPYVVGVVKLAEGPRLVTNIIGVKPEGIYIDMPLQVVFEDVTPEVTLPKFRLRKV